MSNKEHIPTKEIKSQNRWAELTQLLSDSILNKFHIKLGYCDLGNACWAFFKGNALDNDLTKHCIAYVTPQLLKEMKICEDELKFKNDVNKSIAYVTNSECEYDDAYDKLLDKNNKVRALLKNIEN